MQQPLAHLYFLVVLENLVYSDYHLSGLIRTVQSIDKVKICWLCNDTMSRIVRVRLPCESGKNMLTSNCD